MWNTLFLVRQATQCLLGLHNRGIISVRWKVNMFLWWSVSSTTVGPHSQPRSHNVTPDGPQLREEELGGCGYIKLTMFNWEVCDCLMTCAFFFYLPNPSVTVCPPPLLSTQECQPLSLFFLTFSLELYFFPHLSQIKGFYLYEIIMEYSLIYIPKPHG